jgi:hypothetical protein
VGNDRDIEANRTQSAARAPDTKVGIFRATHFQARESRAIYSWRRGYDMVNATTNTITSFTNAMKASVLFERNATL